MGADLNIIDLLKSRNEILDEILYNMKNWDNTIESGINIIESNQEGLDKLGKLNTKMYSITENYTNDEEYNFKLNSIMMELEKLTTSLKDKRIILLEEKQQFNKKDQVINSYISSKRDPVFIDKDIL